MNKPTPQQDAVIQSQANKIKVSANAGSGKTFTIMQRIAHIIEMGKQHPERAISLDQLLVLVQLQVF